MGLTKNAVGKRAADAPLSIQRKGLKDRVVALAGNPNVGKSTVFNALTGMNQHTGNWPGKTVTNAQGHTRFADRNYLLVDIPGTYSLLPHSAEETVARDFICFGEPDAVAVVCDATALERNLNLVLQIMEAHPHVVVCVNLMDEAKRKKIRVDLPLLEKRLGIPVVGTVARKKKSLLCLLQAIEDELTAPQAAPRARIPYPQAIEQALAYPMQILKQRDIGELDARWLALKLLDRDEELIASLKAYLGRDLFADADLYIALSTAKMLLNDAGIDRDGLHDLIATATVEFAEESVRGVVVYEKQPYSTLDRRLDRLFTGRLTGYPVMLLFLAFIFWLTVAFSNIPSQGLSNILFSLLDRLSEWLSSINTPEWLRGVLIDGILRVLCWVVSVMLPPMAIFFPLFTLLEDAGYLPRVAYNLDRPFAKCNACGKQALTMWVVDIRMQKIVIK